jgi:membrane protease YdiL (CAAX protease family)
LPEVEILQGTSTHPQIESPVPEFHSDVEPRFGPEFDAPETGNLHAHPEAAQLASTDPKAPRGIAPIWHTLIIVIVILGYSLWGAIGAKTGTDNPTAPPGGPAHAVANGADHVRLIRYALTGLLELGVVAWVAFGLRLRKVPFRSLFGSIPRGLNNITMEFLVAAAFWVCSMIVLLTCALGWLAIQTQVYKHQSARQSSSASRAKANEANPGQSKANEAKAKSPEQQQTELAKQLMELAPANGIEIAAWAILCLIVGFSEELIFRGYMQSQGIALFRNVPLSLVLTALIFGAAHGYQGFRGIFLISIYGALFGGIALLRKNLFPGMVAHSWHDFATGMALALIRSSHLLEHLPAAPK